MKGIIAISLLILGLLGSCDRTQEFTNIPIYQIAQCEIPISVDHRLLCNPQNAILREKGIVIQTDSINKSDTIGYQITELRGNKGECTVKQYSNNDQIVFHSEYLPSSNSSIDTFNKGSIHEKLQKSFKGQLEFIKKWYPNGNSRSEYNYNNGLLNGLEIQYYENGNKKEIGKNEQLGKFEASYKSDEWVYFDQNGNISKKVNYVKDQMIGKYTEYHPNGNIKVTGTYEYGKGMCEVSIFDPLTYETSIEYVECDRASVKAGIWFYYEESGALISKEENKTN